MRSRKLRGKEAQLHSSEISWQIPINALRYSNCFLSQLVPVSGVGCWQRQASRSCATFKDEAVLVPKTGGEVSVAGSTNFKGLSWKIQVQRILLLIVAEPIYVHIYIYTYIYTCMYAYLALHSPAYGTYDELPSLR